MSDPVRGGYDRWRSVHDRYDQPRRRTGRARWIDAKQGSGLTAPSAGTRRSSRAVPVSTSIPADRLLFVAFVALAMPVAILAALTNAVLVAIARMKGHVWRYRDLYPPTARACFAFAALNAAIFYLVSENPLLLGSEGLGLDAARTINMLFRMCFVADLAPVFGMLDHAAVPLAPANAVCALMAVELLPLLAAAWLIRLGIATDFSVRLGLPRAVVEIGCALIAGLAIWVVLRSSLSLYGTALPIGLIKVMFHGGGIIGGTAALGAIMFALAGAAVGRRDITAIAGSTAMALSLWGAATLVTFYFIRDGDPLVFAILYPQDGSWLDAIGTLDAFAAIQLPGLVLAWLFSDRVASPATDRLVRLTIKLLAGNIIALTLIAWFLVDVPLSL